MLSEAYSLRDVRVLVVGDSGVGKTAFLKRLCAQEASSDPLKTSWTIGCALHVMLHHYLEESFMIEFFDVGGAKLHRISRPVFYKQINGIILTFDLTNSKSFANLRKWIHELVQCHLQHPIDESQNRMLKPQFPTTSTSKNDLGKIPILIVGCKLDVTDRKKPRYEEIYNTVKVMGIDSVFLSSAHDHYFDNQPVLEFLDQVIKARYFSEREPSSVAPLYNRRLQDHNQIVVNFGQRIDPVNNTTHPFGSRLPSSHLK